jgi:hypothetical protein
VVGKQRRGQVHGTCLLNACIDDAKKSGVKGVCVVTSSRPWVADKGLFIKNGFESVQSDGPFELMVKRFKRTPVPEFIGMWDQTAEQFGKGFTVLRTDQCPYIENATKTIIEEAEKLGFKSKVVEVKTRKDLVEKMPYPYGTFAVVLDGKRFSYHYLLPGDIKKMLNR